MSIGKANCLICAKPLVYWEEAQPVTCVICGKEETGHCVCEDGHYVCDICHRQRGVDYALELCGATDSTNPIELFQQAINNQAIYPNGPEHHTLVGACLLAAYCNAAKAQGKGEPDVNKMLAELKKRSMQVPGGTCGFWGVCGAAVSAGQFLSIVVGSTPMTQEPWAQCQQLTSNILGRLAEIGGPRCCKRTGFVSILESVDFVEKELGVAMDVPEKVLCGHFERNEECRKKDCPFYPL